MQINRLTEIVFALLRNENMTAKSLAERFRVSARTIYRDIDVLSFAGVPVYTDKGNGGGIRIDSRFKLDNAILSEKEQQELLMLISSQGAAFKHSETNRLIEKLGAVFAGADSYIEVDFSDWRSDSSMNDNFEIIKRCILCKRVIEFDYYNADGCEMRREVEPLKLAFKHRAWYMYAFCRYRGQERMFKLARISGLVEKDEKFERRAGNYKMSEFDRGSRVNIRCIIDKSMKSRVYDDFGRSGVKTNEHGDFVVESAVPVDMWLYSYLLSYGDKIFVEKPESLRNEIREIHRRAGETGDPKV